MVIVSPPTGAIPVANGRFIAYRWGVTNHLLTGMILQAWTWTATRPEHRFSQLQFPRRSQRLTRHGSICQGSDSTYQVSLGRRPPLWPIQGPMKTSLSSFFLHWEEKGLSGRRHRLAPIAENLVSFQRERLRGIDRPFRRPPHPSLSLEMSQKLCSDSAHHPARVEIFGHTKQRDVFISLKSFWKNNCFFSIKKPCREFAGTRIGVPLIFYHCFRDSQTLVTYAL